MQKSSCECPFVIDNAWYLDHLIVVLCCVVSKLQEDFYAVVDWAYKIDPLRCISMHGITERYLSGQKADAAGFVRLLLGDLESRISMQFSRVSSSLQHELSCSNFNCLKSIIKISFCCSLLMKHVIRLKEMREMSDRLVSCPTSQGENLLLKFRYC